MENDPAGSGSTAALKVTAEQVRGYFNDIPSILYYTRAAHSLGLWKSERLLVDRFLPDTRVRVLEAGCGAGRVAVSLWKLGYRRVSAFDYADELIDQAQSLASDLGVDPNVFRCADATTVAGAELGLAEGEAFDAVLFMFNGLMQIPGRENRRSALRRLHALCRERAPLIFTSHDRDLADYDDGYWRAERARWDKGLQDPGLREFGDRRFQDESGQVFIHIPDRAEVLEDLAVTGWVHHVDSMRDQLAIENSAVSEFSDNCRFWVAFRGPAGT